MRALSLLLCLLWPLAVRGSARAEDAGMPAPARAEDAATPALAAPVLGAPAQAPMRPVHEPGSRVSAPAAPPATGACLGGTCTQQPSLLELSRVRPYALPVLPTKRKVPRRERFAYTGAVLGTVSAGLVLGGAIAIGVVDDLHSERITRGVWLGYLATSTPLVAFSAWLARREGGSAGFLALRRFGWLAYALSISDGALLWSSAFADAENPRFLTIAAGVFGALALLPHALEALHAARALRSRRFRPAVSFQGTGVVLRF